MRRRIGCQRLECLSPRKGLCLNALYDGAFDRGHMWIEKDSVSFSRTLLDRIDDASKWPTSYHGKPVQYPPACPPIQPSSTTTPPLPAPTSSPQPFLQRLCLDPAVAGALA
ncbi:hypothetical protein BH09VER1_BH09VER1_28190 [soil metagenome]